MNGPLIIFRGVEIPGPPLKAQDEPDLCPTFVSELKERPWDPDSREFRVIELMGFWRRERPTMWSRMSSHGVARKYAIKLLRGEDEAINEGHRNGLLDSEAIVVFGDDGWWRTSESDEYQCELEAWFERITSSGLDPLEVLDCTRPS